jgi:hypothetical protein
MYALDNNLYSPFGGRGYNFNAHIPELPVIAVNFWDFQPKYLLLTFSRFSSVGFSCA